MLIMNINDALLLPILISLYWIIIKKKIIIFNVDTRLNLARFYLLLLPGFIMHEYDLHVIFSSDTCPFLFLPYHLNWYTLSSSLTAFRCFLRVDFDTIIFSLLILLEHNTILILWYSIVRCIICYKFNLERYI